MTTVATEKGEKMSSGMNLEEAKEYAETMSYRKAINNIRYAKGIAYKKATWIKLRELAEIADRLVRCGECKWEWTMKCPPHRMGLIHDESDYCSYGIRRADDE